MQLHNRSDTGHVIFLALVFAILNTIKGPSGLKFLITTKIADYVTITRFSICKSRVSRHIQIYENKGREQKDMTGKSGKIRSGN